MSRHELEVPLKLGRLPRYTGAVGLLTSMNDAPVVPPKMMYSLPVCGSVQPHMLLPLPPPIVDSGIVASRSMLLQGNVAAMPLTHAAATWIEAPSSSRQAGS